MKIGHRITHVFCQIVTLAFKRGFTFSTIRFIDVLVFIDDDVRANAVEIDLTDYGIVVAFGVDQQKIHVVNAMFFKQSVQGYAIDLLFHQVVLYVRYCPLMAQQYIEMKGSQSVTPHWKKIQSFFDSVKLSDFLPV